MVIIKKRIVVTGAASGIGKEIAKLLIDVECSLLIVDRNPNALSSFLNNLPSHKAIIYSFICDVGNQDQLDGLFDHAIKIMGGIDIFIANAGFAYYEQLIQADWERMDQIYKVNVYSPIYTSIRMRKLHPDTPYKVVVTASAIGKLGLPGYALYAATKSAIDRFAEAYRFELDDPSSLTLVYPIATRTQFFHQASKNQAPTPWPSQTPQQVAHAILRGINKDSKSIYPSGIYRIFFLLGGFFPFLYRLEQQIELQRFKRWISENAGEEST
ncbi:MAG: SDR family oxidoreductase [Anaerolineaceae bacterium]|nr:SDR family oxidoreductase [Anaerolineaceae bacterium]